MLDDRSRTLLKALVEHYIADGQPVGSRALSKFSGLDLSPATIRNVMADLEEAGFVASPHTSAGRVPTPRGYRLFVDNLLTVRPLEVRQLGAMEEALHGQPANRVISSASQLLSNLTHFAGVVMAPVGWRLSPAEWAFIVNDTQAKLVFAGPGAWSVDGQRNLPWR